MSELLIIDRYGTSGGEASFAVRCHSGTFRINDRIMRAVDPRGGKHQVELTCTEIKLNKDTFVDEIEANYGGSMTFAGVGTEIIDAEWVLQKDA